MRWLVVAFTVAVAGCATSLRVGASPTVDTMGNWGAMATLTLALGQSYRNGAAAALVAADVSGAIDVRVGGHVGLGIGLDALGESRRFGFRMGLVLDGRAILPSGAAGGAIGGRIGLLPVVHYRHVGRAPEHCGESESWTYWHLGLELSGRYLWGADARGLFAAGPVFEIDALSTSACD